jgi:HD superfamily phosphohydrolase
LPQAWHSDIKIMNDGLHGHMHMPTYCVEFIDTPQFQRLRDLKQLGTSYYGTLALFRQRHNIERC